MKPSVTALGAGLLGACLLIVPAPASAAPPVTPGTAIGPIAGLVAGLDLTDTQKQQIRQVFSAHKQDLVALAGQERTARTALRAAIRQPAVDRPAVRAASAAVARVDVDLAVERAEIYAEVVAVLVPAQRATLDEALARLESTLSHRLETLVLFLESLL